MQIFKLLVVTCIIMIFIVACKKSDNKTNDNVTVNIEFNVITVADSVENYTNDSTLYNVIKISYFEAKGDSTQKLFIDNINEDFFTWLSSFLFTEAQYTVTKNNINDVVTAEIKKFINDIDADESLIDCESCRNAELAIDASEFYQTDKIMSIVYSHYQYSGGAHGYYGIATFNYSKQTAEPITINNLSANIDELTTIAEKAFIRQIGDIKDFWFDGGIFYLPKIFYFTEKGIVFYYSIYEIACYADGAITLELEYNQVKNLIKYMK